MDFVKGKLVEKTLKKDGGSWKLYSLVIETEEGKDNFMCFDSLGKKEGSKSLTLNDLQEGKEYSFGIVENEKGKSIAYAQVSKFPSKKQPSSKAVFKGGSGDRVFNMVNLDDEKYAKFCEQYIQRMRIEKKVVSSNHFIGALMRQYSQDFGEDFVKKLENLYTKKVQEEAELDMDLANKPKDVEL